ncbi:MAG: SpoIIIAH-like family protein [Clostridia bacterium]|nr:SpoIIIAH-like family protein [Clostridia bacterium]
MMNFLKSKENQKQILLCVIAITFIVLGTINLNSNVKNEEFAEGMLEVASRNVLEENLGDVELVSSSAIVENESLDSTTSDEEKIEEIKSEDDNYFEETKLERNRMYSESIEIYQNILKNSELKEDQKLIATNEITKLTNMKNGILVCENLIKNKGIDDVVILENNGIINVVVKSSYLKKEEVSQIQNIIERHLNVDVQNISITRK